MRKEGVGLLIAFLTGAGGAVAGCNFIVGAGDYAVGDGGVILHAEGGKPGDGSASKDGKAGKDVELTDAGGSGLLGDPCASNADCTRGTCDGVWCTEPCQSSSQCGSNDRGQQNICTSNSNGEQVCVPGCGSEVDCKGFGATCTDGVCVLTDGGTFGDGGGGGGGGKVGDPCGDGGAECAEGMMCIGWCTTVCKSNKDTSCGDNSLGGKNYCVESAATNDAGQNIYYCFPGCTTNADCSPFSATTCQTQTTNAPGLICSGTTGAVGDPCSAEGDWNPCEGDAGESCNTNWCTTTSCASDTTCGKNSTGQANHCVKEANDAGTTSCFPGCTTGDDCAPYPDTFCLPLTNSDAEYVCSLSQGQIGDPCTSDSDCKETGATCEGSWCSILCSSGQCGMNSAQQTNQCILASDDNKDHCFPGCATTADCIPFPGTTCQTILGSLVCSF